MKAFLKVAFISAAAHTLLILIVHTLRATVFASETPSNWLSCAAGTLGFPLLALSNPAFQADPGKPPLIFHWWNGDVFTLSWVVWTLNVACWSVAFGWIWIASDRTVAIVASIALVILNSICYGLLITIEYTPEWRDFIAVFGTLATLLAFAIALQQIIQARRVAAAASAAHQKATHRFKKNFFQYALSEGHKIISRCQPHITEAKQKGSVYRWTVVHEYVTVAVALLHASKGMCREEDAQAYNDLCQALRDCAIECHRLSLGSGQFQDIAWTNLVSQLDMLRSQYIDPIQVQELTDV